jgi:hypothetical protein
LRRSVIIACLVGVLLSWPAIGSAEKQVVWDEDGLPRVLAEDEAADDPGLSELDDSLEALGLPEEGGLPGLDASLEAPDLPEEDGLFELDASEDGLSELLADDADFPPDLPGAENEAGELEDLLADDDNSSPELPEEIDGEDGELAELLTDAEAISPELPEESEIDGGIDELFAEMESTENEEVVAAQTETPEAEAAEEPAEKKPAEKKPVPKVAAVKETERPRIIRPMLKATNAERVLPGLEFWLGRTAVHLPPVNIFRRVLVAGIEQGPLEGMTGPEAGVFKRAMAFAILLITVGILIFLVGLGERLLTRKK